MTIKNTLIGVGLVILGLIVGYFAFHASSAKYVASASYPTISAQTGESLVYQSNQNAPIGQSTVDPNGGIFNNSLGDYVTTGTFGPASGQSVVNGAAQIINYVASSTLFSVQNPYGATSTVVFSELYGTSAAAPMSLYVGTSTVPTGISISPSLTNLYPNLVNGTTTAGYLATSTRFFITPGVTIGSALGFQSPGTPSFLEIQVGPGDYLVGYATSSCYGAAADTCSGQFQTTIAGAASALSGTYSFEWYR